MSPDDLPPRQTLAVGNLDIVPLQFVLQQAGNHLSQMEGGLDGQNDDRQHKMTVDAVTADRQQSGPAAGIELIVDEQSKYDRSQDETGHG